MYEYFLFDLDGTLTDPKEGICKSVQYALKKHNIDEPDIDKLEPFIGPPLVESFKEFYGMDEIEALEAVEDYRERFSVTGLYENEVYEGVPKLLEKIRESGGKLAVASSKPAVYVEKILKHFNLDEYFDVVVGSELDGRRQNKSEVVNEALMQLYYGNDTLGKDLDAATELKAKTVMIGDRKFDIIGAKEAGIKSVGVLYGYGSLTELRNAKADHIATNMKKLQDILLSNKYDNMPLPNEEDDEAAKLLLPTSSFAKSVYVLTPLVIYYLCMTITINLGKIILNNMMQRNLDWQHFIVDHSRTISAICSLTGMAIGSLVIFLYYRKRDKIVIKSWRGLAPTVIWGGFAALALNLIIGLIYLAVSSKGLPDSSNDVTIPILLASLLYVVASPVVEELVFRWLIYGRMKRIMGKWIAVIVSALFFGVYHGSLLQGIYAFCMGIGLALVYEWSGTILAPLLFHMGANGFVYYSMYLPKKVQEIASSYAGIIVITIIAIIMTYCVYMIAHNKGKEVSEND